MKSSQDLNDRMRRERDDGLVAKHSHPRGGSEGQAKDFLNKDPNQTNMSKVERAGVSDETLKPGDRCRFTEVGKSRSPKLRDKIGTVILSATKSGKIIVLLDGNKHPTTYHRSYLERLS